MTSIYWVTQRLPQIHTYCKSRNPPNTDTQNYSRDLRYVLGHPVCNCLQSPVPIRQNGNDKMPVCLKLSFFKQNKGIFLQL